MQDCQIQMHCKSLPTDITNKKGKGIKKCEIDLEPLSQSDLKQFENFGIHVIDRDL
jgi:spore germination protein YaaH